MTGSHLSDDKIQSYLDNRISKTEKSLIEKHLRSCTECMKKLENYEMIFGELDKELKVDLNEHFTDSVMSRIRDEQLEFESKKEVDPLIFLFALVGVSFAAALVYYIDFSNIYGILSQLNFSETFQQKLNDFAQSYSSVSKFFVLGGIGAGVLYAMDKVIGKFFNGFRG